MTAFIEPAVWLRFTAQEYLSSFIRDGGCAIKFAVPLDDFVRPDVLGGIARIAHDAGYLLVEIDAAQTKIHLIDELFFRAASQIPWEDLSRKVIATLADAAGYAWADEGDDPLYQRLAEKNRVDPQMLLLDLKKAIGDKVFKRRDLSRDFRVAMTSLCIAELTGGEDGAAGAKLLTDWLTGRNKAVSAVTQFQIFRKINRATARYFFESTTHWLKLAGCPGMVVLIDAARIKFPRNPNDGGIFYSKAAVLDAYEVLRQFIDGAGRLRSCFIAVVPDVAFLEDPSRGIDAYEALKFRVFDEVRDRYLVNPMASLARISTSVRGGLALCT